MRHLLNAAGNLTCAVAALLFVIAAIAAAQPVSTAPIFTFETDEFWLNLHHFLYVLGRADAGLPDATRDAVAGAPADASRGLARMSEPEQRQWRQAVAAYAAGPSRSDTVFDPGLNAIDQVLTRADTQSSLQNSAVDANVAAILEDAAPLYRRVWWPDHRAANQRWVAALQPLLDREGPAILRLILGWYQLPWPAGGYPIHMSAYANWAGAFSTVGPTLIVGSLDPAMREHSDNALETVFHESMHQWDDTILGVVNREARAKGIRLPGNVSHGLLFYTAGAAVARVVPGHVPIADQLNLWPTFGPIKPAIIEAWQPYLDGQGMRDDAIARVVGSFGQR
jgi:hypothetical protein